MHLYQQPLPKVTNYFKVSFKLLFGLLDSSSGPYERWWLDWKISCKFVNLVILANLAGTESFNQMLLEYIFEIGCYFFHGVVCNSSVVVDGRYNIGYYQGGESSI